MLWVNRQKPLCLGDLHEILATLLCISNYSRTQHKYTPSLFSAYVLVHYVAIVQVAVLMSHKVKNIHWTYSLRPVLRLNFAKYLACNGSQVANRAFLLFYKLILIRKTISILTININYSGYYSFLVLWKL